VQVAGRLEALKKRMAQSGYASTPEGVRANDEARCVSLASELAAVEANLTRYTAKST